MVFNSEFYPTPEPLLRRISEGVDWNRAGCVLEPSAGKGSICDFIRSASPYREVDIDCIEKDPELRAALIGKGYRVVADDFLEFSTYKKYGLIFMNPPFSEGARHLLKALDIQKDGGGIICILNAETIRNPYTAERRELAKKLAEYGAGIEFIDGGFVNAERRTSVEIAVIKAAIPEKEKESEYFEMYRRLKAKECMETEPEPGGSLPADRDIVKALVMQYEAEAGAGIAFINEYKALQKHIMRSVKEDPYDSPILELKVNGKDGCSVNKFVKAVRLKYWKALFASPKFMGKMTSSMQEHYQSEVYELAEYDFSRYNILQVKERMEKTVISGIEECIIGLFDELTHKYACNEYSSNIHLYNGWKTNDACRINQKVVLPWYHAKGYNYATGKYILEVGRWENIGKLSDMEKALNYLDCGLTTEVDLRSRLRQAQEEGRSRNIHLKFFDVTFYKKGTIHIVFTNEELLKKLNIFGSQKKGWLPFSYGRKKYSEMDRDEQAVIDGFEGEESYRRVMADKKYYLFDGGSLMIGEKQKAGNEQMTDDR